jgi:hypothetical protein
MALELLYYGHNVSMFGPDVALTGDPSIDNAAVAAAGYLAGALVKLAVSSNNPDGVALVLADGNVDGAEAILGAVITEPGEFANTIGPSGSNRISVARGYWVGNLYNGAFQPASGTNLYTVGAKLYCGNGTSAGKYTSNKTVAQDGNTAAITGNPVGVVTHTPTTTEPWLGIASLI